VLVRGGGERELEIVVLRHQLAILGRGGKRPRYTTVDRALLAAASRLLPSERWSCFAVSPRTLRRWHRILLEGGWRGRRRRPGRPPLAAETRGLVCRLARENPRWGYMRIQGELLKLGIGISATTIATVLRASGLGPAPRRIGPSWSEFLRAQAQSMLGDELRSRMGGGLEGYAAEPSGPPEDGEARELEADRDKLPSAVAAEPRVASHPLPVRSRSTRPRQRVLPPPRAPLRLPPAHRSHARDGPPTSGARPAAECSGARSKPSPVAPRPGQPRASDRFRKLPGSSALRHRRTAPTPPRSYQPESSFFTPQGARGEDWLQGLRRIGIDEVSYRKGRRYLLCVVCHDSGRIVWARPGKSRAVLHAFFDELGEEGCARLEAVSADMHGAWPEVIRARASNALVCADPFHVVRAAGEALETLRRQDWRRLRREDPERAVWLKGTRFVLRRRADSLSEGERTLVDELAETNERVYRGWLLVDQLRAVYQAADGDHATLLLDEWLRAARASMLVPFIRVAATLAEHREGIVNAIVLGLSNARLEAMNSTVRLISHRSRGFRRLDSLLAMIRLVCGKVPVALPT